MEEKSVIRRDREIEPPSATREHRRQELIVEIERFRHALDAAREVYNKTNIEHRELRLIHKAEDDLTIARGKLRRLEEAVIAEAVKSEAETAFAKMRTPPDLQALVMQHGAYDMIPQWAWNQFDADMAEWKHQMRTGEPWLERHRLLQKQPR